MQVRRVDDLRQKLRMRGLRSHPMYCRNKTRMQIVPLLASRAQALRYSLRYSYYNLNSFLLFLRSGKCWLMAIIISDNISLTGLYYNSLKNGIKQICKHRFTFQNDIIRFSPCRYLFVRWRLNVANMYVVLGENGDTDYEELISGTHKTLILKGVVEKGSEELLRVTDIRDDMVPSESPLIAHVSPEADEIANALQQLAKASSGM